MDKQQQFIDWVCGEQGVKFPFFQDFQKVEFPNFEVKKNVKNILLKREE